VGSSFTAASMFFALFDFLVIFIGVRGPRTGHPRPPPDRGPWYPGSWPPPLQSRRPGWIYPGMFETTLKS
jgi:hypothetical protein